MTEYVRNAEGVVIGTFHPLKTKTKTRWAWILALYPIFFIIGYLVWLLFMGTNFFQLGFIVLCISCFTYMYKAYSHDRNIVVARGTKDASFYWYLVLIIALPVIGIPVYLWGRSKWASSVSLILFIVVFLVPAA